MIFWLHRDFVAVWAFYSYGKQGLLFVGVQGLLLFRGTGSRHAGFSSCSPWAQLLWLMALVAPRHVESSQTRNWTHVPCIGRQIPIHCATREVLPINFYVHIKIKLRGLNWTAKKIAFSLCQSYLIPHSPYHPKSSEITTWNYLSWSHGSVASILWKCNQTLIIWKKKKTRSGMVSCWRQNETVNHSSFCQNPHDLALMLLFALLPLSKDSRHYHYVKLCSLPCIWNCLLASLPAKHSSTSLTNTLFLQVSPHSHVKPPSTIPDREEHSFSWVSMELCTHSH